MNAKEKAVELIDKMYYIGRYDDKEDYNPAMAWERAKQCALIAVEEILQCEATEPSDTDWDDCGATAQYYWPQKKVDAGKFWGDVKSELLLAQLEKVNKENAELKLRLSDVIKSLPDSEEIRMKARELDEKDFDQWWWETVYKGNVL